MPYKRKYKKRYKRKKRYGSAMSRQGIPAGQSAMRRATLRYVETFDLASVDGLLNSFTFSANSIFDPNITGVGHQPMGHDTWQTLYNHYCVTSSKMTIKLIPKDNPTTSVVGAFITDAQASPYSNSDDYQEARKGSTRLIGQKQASPVTLTSSYSAKKFFNVHDIKDNFSRLGGTFGSNPVEQAYYKLWVQSADALSDPTFIAVVQIDYNVIFSEPKDLNQS